MTKDEAIALQPGDTIFVVDNSFTNPFDVSVSHHALLNNGIQRITIGEHRLNGRRPVSISAVTGYLLDAELLRNLPPEWLFHDAPSAFAFLQECVLALRNRLADLDDILERRLDAGRTLVMAMAERENDTFDDA